MTDAELQAMRERDEKSHATWYSKPLGRPESGPAQCFQDRRALIAWSIEARAALAYLHAGFLALDLPANSEILDKLEELLGVVAPIEPPIAGFANRADPDQQQAEGDDDDQKTG